MNNGHGPCQDTCRNTIGGYECSCEGLQDTLLSADNHTCQDAGPCSVNNAGCSHTCLSTMGRVFCLCPDGFILEDDWKTCQGNRIRPALTTFVAFFLSLLFKSQGTTRSPERGQPCKSIELQMIFIGIRLFMFVFLLLKQKE